MCPRPHTHPSSTTDTPSVNGFGLSDSLLGDADNVLAGSVVADAHTHPRAIIPRPARHVAETLVHFPFDPLDNLTAGGINLALVTAVGDAMGTVWRPGNATAAVTRQLTAAQEEAESAQVAISTTVTDMDPTSRPRLLLGIEGADVIGDQPDLLEQFYKAGVRTLGLIHYGDNALGTTSTSILGRRGSRAVRHGRRRAGLTSTGATLIADMNELGMLIDMAHADTATTLEACEATSQPLISSHTAAAEISDFPRYISDPEIEAIAATGGLVGLWPIRLRDIAMNNLDDFARHAEHLATLVGTEHIGIGTDKNGVPSYIDGYRNSSDYRHLAAALLKTGFDGHEVAAIMGGNLQRVLERVLKSPL